MFHTPECFQKKDVWGTWMRGGGVVIIMARLGIHRALVPAFHDPGLSCR